MTPTPYLTAGQTATSRAAGEMIAPLTPSLESRVYEQIVLAGERGLTNYEVGQILGLKHQTCSARCTSLKKQHLVHPNGQKRPTDSGCDADVLVATRLAGHVYAVIPRRGGGPEAP